MKCCKVHVLYLFKTTEKLNATVSGTLSLNCDSALQSLPFRSHCVQCVFLVVGDTFQPVMPFSAVSEPLQEFATLIVIDDHVLELLDWSEGHPKQYNRLFFFCPRYSSL